MKLLTVLSSGALFVSSTAAANLGDVEFLTVLVGDFDNHKAEYLLFLRTADNVPAQLTSLALKVVTYTDDSYTTLLDNSDINVTQLKSFATELPWYSRISAEAEGASVASAASSSSSSSQTSSTGSSGSGTSMMALAGALIGAVAVLLL